MRTIGLIFTFVVFLLFLTILALIGALFGLFFAPVWLFVAAGALVALSTFLGTRAPAIRRLKLKAGLDKPVKIVQLSDLHIGSGFGKRWLSDVVQKTNALAPDVVLITGDLIDGVPESLMDELMPLSQIKAPAYFVWGNHEYYYGLNKWRQAFEKLGLKLLENNAVLFLGLAIGGVGVPYADAVGAPAPDLAQTFARVPVTARRLLLSHYPEVFDKAIHHNVFLQLSGHTHGGQFFFPLSWPTKRANAGYLKGLYRKGNQFLYVSQGTGLWGGLPVRLGTYPEITLFELS